MATIIITEFMDESSVASLAAHHRVVYEPDLADDRPRLLELMADADALIVRNRTIVDDELLESAQRLAIVGRLGVGLDNIDLPACAERSVAVQPATGANTDAVAEYVIAAMLTLVRGAFLSSGDVAAGRWPRTASTGLEVAGRTIGLLGFGAIAQRVAELARCLGMEVIAHDPFLDADDPAWRLGTSRPFADVLAEAHVVSLHVPLTDGTRGLIGRAEIAAMDPTAVLIDTARGGIVDEEAVVEALRTGALRGAALDVFASEPLDAEHGARFAEVPNLILTPHIAGITVESNRRVSDMIAAAVDAALTGGVS
ncbi:hydroxyacid dehydrogenase [Actinomycetota bacterium]|jgi:(S)-sulfolactate dehydrogenase